MKRQLLIQVSQQILFFGREVTVTAKVDFTLASKRRHLAKRARSLQHFLARVRRKFKRAAGVIGYSLCSVRLAGESINCRDGDGMRAGSAVGR